MLASAIPTQDEKASKDTEVQPRIDRLIPSDPRCEYRENPMGIDVTAPRLSWIVESSQRGQKQTAYHVLVAGDLANLRQDQGELWDSGKVESDETVAIVYGGKPLRSHQRCYWKVRVWDKDGTVSTWSKPAFWSMGLLEPGDWRGADWIGSDKSRQNPILPPPAYLRTTFPVAKTVRRATLYATALGIFDVHLNGDRVSDDYFNPGWTDYTKRVYYRAFDVTSQVRMGDNALARSWLTVGTAATLVSARSEIITAQNLGSAPCFTSSWLMARHPTSSRALAGEPRPARSARRTS